MKTAIYARQSADKRDSISIESQIDDCMALAGKEPYIFSDRGFSGATLNRPGFSELMSLVRSKEIDRIIIYRLDRISRSLIDFVILTDELKKLGVTLISRTEGFDTSSETGIILLNILMMFAEMERGAIRRRVTDNYYARGKLGLYLGGYAPIGYDKADTVHMGYKTSYFVPNSDRALVEEIYSLYVNSHMSINSIAAHLNDIGIKGKRGGGWTASSVRRILRSPVYVMADMKVYDYLLSQGCVINSDCAAFDGKHGLISYSGSEQRSGTKHTSFCGENISVGLHQGIIPAPLWLEAQSRRFASVPSAATGKTSWLQGLMKCSCGYSLYTKSYKGRIYLCCRGRKLHLCTDKPCITADELESLLEPMLESRLKLFFKSHPSPCDTSSSQADVIAQIDCEIENSEARLARLQGAELSECIAQLEKLRRKRLNAKKQPPLQDEAEAISFSSLDFESKKLVASLLITRIELSSAYIKLIFT